MDYLKLVKQNISLRKMTLTQKSSFPEKSINFKVLVQKVQKAHKVQKSTESTESTESTKSTANTANLWDTFGILCGYFWESFGIVLG